MWHFQSFERGEVNFTLDTSQDLEASDVYQNHFLFLLSNNNPDAFEENNMSDHVIGLVPDATDPLAIAQAATEPVLQYKPDKKRSRSRSQSPVSGTGKRKKEKTIAHTSLPSDEEETEENGFWC